ncbi:hypothetical protein HDU76_009311 [Blyttiomyces sp. JEL0837]|nr:hypothetical protein HDU76_009311 [Blyttiomyces sp. JEL0837]
MQVNICLSANHIWAHRNLNNKNLTGSLSPALGKLSYLQSNQLTGSIPDSFSNMGNLQYPGNIPDPLFQMFNLLELNLGFNRLTGPIPASFGKMNFLTMLMLRSNQLSGNIPDSIGNMSNKRGEQLFNRTTSDWHKTIDFYPQSTGCPTPTATPTTTSIIVIDSQPATNPQPTNTGSINPQPNISQSTNSDQNVASKVPVIVGPIVGVVVAVCVAVNRRNAPGQSTAPTVNTSEAAVVSIISKNVSIESSKLGDVGVEKLAAPPRDGSFATKYAETMGPTGADSVHVFMAQVPSSISPNRPYPENENEKSGLFDAVGSSRGIIPVGGFSDDKNGGLSPSAQTGSSIVYGPSSDSKSKLDLETVGGSSSENLELHLVQTLGPPIRWTHIEVMEWVRQKGFDAEVVRVFQEHAIDGGVLTSFVREPHVLNDLGISYFFTRAKIIQSIEIMQIEANTVRNFQPIIIAPAVWNPESDVALPPAYKRVEVSLRLFFGLFVAGAFSVIRLSFVFDVFTLSHL